MKFLSGFYKKEKQLSALMRRCNPYVDFLSYDSSSANSKNSSHSSGHSSGHRRPFAERLLEQQNQKLAEAFRIIDKNGDGKISREELKVLWKNLGEKVTDNELRAMVREFDLNGDGRIDLQEFMILNRKVGLGLEDQDDYCEELHLAFNLADVNRDGRISADELRRMMTELGMKQIKLAESSAMLRYVHSGQGDAINYPEFERLMTSSIFAVDTF